MALGVVVVIGVLAYFKSSHRLRMQAGALREDADEAKRRRHERRRSSVSALVGGGNSVYSAWALEQEGRSRQTSSSKLAAAPAGPRISMHAAGTLHAWTARARRSLFRPVGLQ